MNETAPGVGRLQRRFYSSASQSAVNVEARTCELSFSSTAPVPRHFETEVLSHAPGAADLTRLNNGGPLLFNHDTADILGVVERAAISGNKGRAVVRFGRDARGEWALQQVADGVLVNVSFSYVINRSEQQDDGTLLVTAWEALEISLVPVPADNSVGVGRSFNFQRNSVMDEVNNEQRPSRTQRAQASQQEILQQSRAAGEQERARIMEIAAMGRRFGLPEDLITGMQLEGTSVEDARARANQHIQGQASRARPASRFDDDGIGMNDREVQGFSLLRAIQATLTNDWSRAGMEREASRAVESRSGRSTQGFFVPTEVMRRGQWSQRAYSVGGSTTGSTLVETSLLADQFIEVLRNNAVVAQAGASVLSGLVGNVDLPRQNSQTPTYWVGESVNITEGTAGFGSLSLRPKTIGALSLMSRLTLMQTTPALESLIRSDMVAGLGLGVDLAALSGSGAGAQPSGVINAAGLGVVIMGTNGGNVTLDTLTALETQLNGANAPAEGRAYIINPKTLATLKNLKSSTGQYLWTTSPPGQRSGTPAEFNGYPVYVTNQARSTLTKGTSAGICSELFLGAWRDLVIAQWGALEVITNPYGGPSNAWQSGDVGIRAMQTVDIGVRRSASFCVCSDALTP